MTKFRIGIDVDDVIADLSGKIPLVVKELYDLDIDESDLGCYDLYHFLGITDEEGKEFYQRLCDDFDDVNTLPGALEGLRELESRGHEITIVTKRWEQEATQDYLRSIGIGHYPQVFLHAKDPMVDIDFMLDDNPKKLAELIPWIKRVPFLMNRPSNRYCLDAYNRFLRVNSWMDFIRIIKSLEQNTQW